MLSTCLSILRLSCSSCFAGIPHRYLLHEAGEPVLVKGGANLRSGAVEGLRTNLGTSPPGTRAYARSDRETMNAHPVRSAFVPWYRDGLASALSQPEPAARCSDRTRSWI